MYHAIYKNTIKNEYIIQCNSSKEILEKPETGLEIILITENETQAIETFLKQRIKERKMKKRKKETIKIAIMYTILLITMGYTMSKMQTETLMITLAASILTAALIGRETK